MAEATEAEMCRTRGNQSLKAGDASGAVFHYTEGLRYDSEDYRLYSNRAIARLSLHQYELAVNDANECIQREASWAKAYSTKSNALLRLGRASDALEAAQTGLRQNPEAELRNRLQEFVDQASAATRNGNIPAALQGNAELMMQAARAAIFGSILVFVLTGFVFPGWWARPLYTAILFLGISLNVTHLFRAKGMPRFTAEYWATIMAETPTFIVLMGLCLLMGRPTVVTLIPMAHFLFKAFRTIVSWFVGGDRKMDEAGVQILQWLTGRPNVAQCSRAERIAEATPRLRSLVAQLQLTIGFLFVFETFTGRGSLLVLVMYWQLLRLQVAFDDYLRSAFRQLDLFIQQGTNHPSCPSLLTKGYRYVRDYIQSLDPREQAAQQQQQGGGAAAGGGGLASRCVIQ